MFRSESEQNPWCQACGSHDRIKERTETERWRKSSLFFWPRFWHTHTCTRPEACTRLLHSDQPVSQSGNAPKTHSPILLIHFFFFFLSDVLNKSIYVGLFNYGAKFTTRFIYWAFMNYWERFGLWIFDWRVINEVGKFSSPFRNLLRWNCAVHDIGSYFVCDLQNCTFQSNLLRIVREKKGWSWGGWCGCVVSKGPFRVSQVNDESISVGFSARGKTARYNFQ